MPSNRNIQQVRTTWGKWKSSQGMVADAYKKEASLHRATDDTEIIAHKEVTPFGTFTHFIEWSNKQILEEAK